MSRATTLDRLAIKRPESAFLHVLQEEFNFSPRVSRELLSTAKEMLVGSVPSAAVRPGQARLVVASERLLKGYRMDQGSRPTHKKEIVRLYEQELEPPDDARETGHSLKAVERYLQGYERVKLPLKRRVGVEETSSLVGRGKHVVLEYVEIARQYHPELFAGSD